VNRNTNLLPKSGAAFLFNDFLSVKESDSFFEILKNEIVWKQQEIVLFGKKRLQPRLTSFYGERNKTYKYSGLQMVPNEWNTPLSDLRKRIEAFTKQNFTSVLLNYYRNENDSMGWHRDNEKELGEFPYIASLSLGAERFFLFREYLNKKNKIKLNLKSGSLLIMQNETQTYWEHSLPKTKTSGERINLTFRKIY
jgi:alkylated DNA repair dioxygenase AlkB